MNYKLHHQRAIGCTIILSLGILFIFLYLFLTNTISPSLLTISTLILLILWVATYPLGFYAALRISHEGAILGKQNSFISFLLRTPCGTFILLFDFPLLASPLFCYYYIQYYKQDYPLMCNKYND